MSDSAYLLVTDTFRTVIICWLLTRSGQCLSVVTDVFRAVFICYLLTCVECLSVSYWHVGQCLSVSYWQVPDSDYLLALTCSGQCFSVGYWHVPGSVYRLVTDKCFRHFICPLNPPLSEIFPSSCRDRVSHGPLCSWVIVRSTMYTSKVSFRETTLMANPAINVFSHLPRMKPIK
jgi:hypothetical protein